MNKSIAGVILILACLFLYRELWLLGKINHIYVALEILNTNRIILYLSLVALLMLINYGLEALKWRFLIGKYERISFPKAFQAILSGTTIGLFTPNRMGEFFGRVFILKYTPPLKAILITIIGSISQLLTTVVAGSFFLIIMLFIHPEVLKGSFPHLYWGLVFIILFINSILIMLYLNVPFISTILQSLVKPRWINIRKYMRIFASYSGRDLAIVLLYSTIRYCVFTTQYVLLFLMFEIPVSFFTGFALAAIIFLITTAVPTIAISELIVRGSVAWTVFFLWLQLNNLSAHNYETLVFSASGIIWLINIVSPAMLGSIFLFRLRFFRNNV